MNEAMQFDPAILAVMQNALGAICDEMDVVLERAAFNPVMSEARDRANGIYDKDSGDVIAQGATGLPIFVSAVSFLFAGVAASAIALGTEAPTVEAISAGWIEIAYAAVLSTAIGFTFQAIGQQHVPPANAAIILSAESLFAALGGAVVLGERLPAIGYAGAALMFAAILIVEAVPPLWARRRTHAPRTTN